MNGICCCLGAVVDEVDSLSDDVGRVRKEVVMRSYNQEGVRGMMGEYLKKMQVAAWERSQMIFRLGHKNVEPLEENCVETLVIKQSHVLYTQLPSLEYYIFNVLQSLTSLPRGRIHQTLGADELSCSTGWTDNCSSDDFQPSQTT